MEEVEIKRPILGVSDFYVKKFLAICCCFPVIILINVSGIEVKKYPWPLFAACFIGCVFLLYMAIKKILMLPQRTYLTINDDRVIINDKRGQWEIGFNEVDAFERETTRFWRFNIPTDEIIVHLKNGNGYVKMFPADGLTVKPQQLCDLLNERLSEYQKNEKKHPKH